jgi:hypothetical protein
VARHAAYNDQEGGQMNRLLIVARLRDDAHDEAEILLMPPT